MNSSIVFLLLVGYCISGCMPPSNTSPTPSFTPPAPHAYAPPSETSLTARAYMHFKAEYDISLIEVERPAKAKQRYGDQKIEKSQEEGISKYYFEDDMVRILWLPSADKIEFILNNKTDHSIKIAWDEASFVDAMGRGHRIMHSGVKYNDRNNPQPPTVVVRHGSINDIVFPTDYVSWSSTEWNKLPLLSNSQRGGRDELKANIGKTLQVLLPLQIEDVVNDYIFTFKVNGAEVTQE